MIGQYPQQPAGACSTVRAASAASWSLRRVSHFRRVVAVELDHCRGRMHERRHPERIISRGEHLRARYLHLLHAGKAGPQATIAVVRELGGFAWAETTA